MNTKGVKENVKKYIIFTTIVSIGVIAFLIGDDTKTEVSKNTNTEILKVEETKIIEENRCLDVPDNLLKAIESGLTIDGGGNLKSIQAVKSKDFESVYFIAGILEGPGFENIEEIAVFTSNSLVVGEGMIGSVNSMAKEFSVYPTFKAITKYDDGIKQSQECIKN